MSYIGKNPKVDSVKLDGSATVPTGAAVEGQVYFNTGTAVTVTLPSAVTNAAIIFKDSAGTAATNNITINRADSATIDGATSQTISSNYGSMKLISDGTNWFIT